MTNASKPPRTTGPSISEQESEIDNAHHGLARTHSTLAQPAGGGETPPPLGEHSAQRCREHGLRAGTGGPSDARSGSRPSPSSARHIETLLGRLTYAELSPHLALAVQTVEERIESGEFDASPLDEALILAFQRLSCGELTPQLAGWRRCQVQVGPHIPPEFYRIPALMREYALDLQARLSALPDDNDYHLLETLAFAEGRLLSIHPFADFNGRTTRVFLRLLLRKLDLPVVRLAPPPESTPDYLEALSAADRADWSVLMGVWRDRFEQTG